MRNGERGHDERQHAQSPERDHQAQYEQQMVGTVENMVKARFDEPQRGLMPARIEPDQSGVAVEFESANRTAGRQKAQRDDDLQSQPLQLRAYRKVGAAGIDRVLEHHIEQTLVP